MSLVYLPDHNHSHNLNTHYNNASLYSMCNPFLR